MLFDAKKIALLCLALCTLCWPNLPAMAETATVSREAALQMFELPEDASPEQINKQFRKLSKKYHPDAGGTAEQFIQLQNAYEALSTPSRRATATDVVMYPAHRINVFEGLHGIPLKKEMERLTDAWDKTVGKHFDTALARSQGRNGNVRPNLDPEIFRSYIEAHRAFMEKQLLKSEFSGFATIFNAEFIPLLKKQNPSVDHFVAAFAKQLANMGESGLLETFLKGFDFPGRVNDRDIKRYKELREFLLADHSDPKVQAVLNEFTDQIVKGDHFFSKRPNEYLELARKGKITWEALSEKVSRSRLSPDLYNFANELLRNLSEQERNHVASMQIYFNSNSASEVPAIRTALMEMSEKDLPWYNWGHGALFGQWKNSNRALLYEILAKFEEKEPGFLARKHDELKKLISNWNLNSEYRRAEMLAEADKSYKKLKQEFATFLGQKPLAKKPFPKSCQTGFRALVR